MFFAWRKGRTRLSSGVIPVSIISILSHASALAAPPSTPPGRIAAPADMNANDPDQQGLCLASAIYFEAAHEPRAGQEAVARVVLNRTHDPAYPATICGVVWQGHERATGCQFSFTCDGSLARAPEPRSWARVVALARNVLDNAVSATAPLSTGPLARALHYHADYVRPRWRVSMTEVARIGRHIFYAPPGTAPDHPQPQRTVALVSEARDGGPPLVWGLRVEKIAADAEEGRRSIAGMTR